MPIRDELKKTPPLKDPSWPARSESTRVFLARPRTWKDINAWRRGVRIGAFEIRNILANLEHAGQVRSVYQNEVVVWVQMGVTVQKNVRRPSQATEEPPDTSDEALLRQLLPDPEDAEPEQDLEEEPDEQPE